MRLIDADILEDELSDSVSDNYTAIHILNEAPTIQAIPIDVLDKIRAEIEHLTITEGGEDYTRKMAELYSLKIKVLQIIDKYTAESKG